VVYNTLSGCTHILDIVAGEVLKIVMRGAVATEQIQAEIAAFLDIPNDQRAADSVYEVLAMLDELGLIEATSARC